jgi:hypothetical protein
VGASQFEVFRSYWKLKLTSNIISDEQVGQFAKFIEVSSDVPADKLASVITQWVIHLLQLKLRCCQCNRNSRVLLFTIQVLILALGATTSTLGSEAESSRSATNNIWSNRWNDNIRQNLEKVKPTRTYPKRKELSTQFKQDATGVFEICGRLE